MLQSLLKVIVELVMTSIGIYLLLKKFQFDKKWWAFLPGFRYVGIGMVSGRPRDGSILGLLDVLTILLNFINLDTYSEKVELVLALLILVIIIMLYVYVVRVYMRLLEAFDMKRKWLWILFILVAEWLAVLILGASKRYQPKRQLDEGEDWEAGTAPAELAGVEEAAHSRVLSNEGLSVDLRERTVKDFNKKRYLLKDISLDIPNGSLVLLLGGSGAGKTTFVNAIIGYEKADATVLLNGTDVYKDYDQVKYRIGFVPQQNLIRGNDTVQHTVKDAADIRMPADLSIDDRRDKIAEVMDLLGLSAGSEGLVSKKSGGQLRRISIAMELVTGPELFVLDEPDSGLDGVIAREIFTNLRAIADEGRIVIVITHTPDRVIDLFDKVIVLAKDSGRVGRLAFYGSPAEAREFFGKETMEGVVMSVNRKEEGGDGLADEYIERYAQRIAAPKEEVTA